MYIILSHTTSTNDGTLHLTETLFLTITITITMDVFASISTLQNQQEMTELLLSEQSINTSNQYNHHHPTNPALHPHRLAPLLSIPMLESYVRARKALVE